MIENDVQLANSQLKLKKLEELQDRAKSRPMASEALREMTLGSLKKRINMMIEEIVRYRSRNTQATRPQ